MPLLCRFVLLLTFHAGNQTDLPPDLDRLYKEGQRQFSQRNFEEAGKAFRAISDARPRFAPAHYWLGRIAAAQRDFAKAARFYQSALSIQPDFAEAVLSLAEIALVSGRPDQAIARLEPLVREAPSPQAHLLLARAWSEVDANRSLPLLEKLFETDPENREAWELWIDIMAAAGREDQGIERLEQHLARRPGAASLRLLLGQLYVNRGALARAEEAFQQALAKGSSDPEIEKRALYSLGYLWVSLGRSEEGERALRQVLDKDGEYLPAVTALADLLINAARLDEVDQVLARAQKLEPENPEVLVLVGRYELRRKQPTRAVAVLSTVVRAHPEHLQAHFFLGQALKDLGRLAEAKRQLDHFQELRKKKRAGAVGRHSGLAVEGIK